MSHLHVEERPQVMKIRHNLQLNIPQSGATPHTKLGRVMHHQADCLPPILMPPLLFQQYSSCSQEAAESGTPHRIAPRQTSLLFYVFSGLPQQQQSPLKRTKTTDKTKNRKRAANSLRREELNHEASRLIQQIQDKANKVQGIGNKISSAVLVVLTSNPVSTGRSRRCCCCCLEIIIISESLRRNQGKVSQEATG